VRDAVGEVLDGRVPGPAHNVPADADGWGLVLHFSTVCAASCAISPFSDSSQERELYFNSVVIFLKLSPSRLLSSYLSTTNFDSVLAGDTTLHLPLPPDVLGSVYPQLGLYADGPMGKVVILHLPLPPDVPGVGLH